MASSEVSGFVFLVLLCAAGCLAKPEQEQPDQDAMDLMDPYDSESPTYGRKFVRVFQGWRPVAKADLGSDGEIVDLVEFSLTHLAQKVCLGGGDQVLCRTNEGALMEKVQGKLLRVHATGAKTQLVNVEGGLVTLYHIECHTPADKLVLGIYSLLRNDESTMQLKKAALQNKYHSRSLLPPYKPNEELTRVTCRGVNTPCLRLDAKQWCAGAGPRADSFCGVEAVFEFRFIFGSLLCPCCFLWALGGLYWKQRRQASIEARPPLSGGLKHHKSTTIDL